MRRASLLPLASACEHRRMGRNIARENRLPEPYRSAVRKFAAVARHAKHSILYSTAEALVAHGGVLADGYTAREFFVGLDERIRQLAAEERRLAAATRKEEELAARLSVGEVLDPWKLSHDARYRRGLRGKEVWLFHGTTSKRLPAIRREGLHPRGVRAEQIWGSPMVFLTAKPGDEPCGAYWYAKRAARLFGGEPTVVMVLAAFDDLEPDPDDADISCGHVQFASDDVPPAALFTLDAKPLVR